MSDTATAKLPRDKRADLLGYVNELVRRFADTIKTELKVRMTNEELDRVAGDVFEAVLTRPFESTVDPAKLLKLYDEEKISRAQYLSATRVVKEPLEKFLSGDQIARMSSSAPGTPRLNLKRIGTVEVKLVDAVRALSESVK